MYQDKTGPYTRIGRYEYVVADVNEALSRRYEPDGDPCQGRREEECADWLRERLTELYNE